MVTREEATEIGGGRSYQKWHEDEGEEKERIQNEQDGRARAWKEAQERDEAKDGR